MIRGEESVGGVTNVTVTQKALWLCRGVFGKRPRMPLPLLMGCEGREVSALCPLTPTKQINTQQKQPPPPIPIITTLCSTTRSRGNPFLGEERKMARFIWRREDKKERGFTVRCGVK